MNINLSKPQEMVKNREVWCAAAQGITKSQTWVSDWTTTRTKGHCSTQPKRELLPQTRQVVFPGSGQSLDKLFLKWNRVRINVPWEHFTKQTAPDQLRFHLGSRLPPPCLQVNMLDGSPSISGPAFCFPSLCFQECSSLNFKMQISLRMIRLHYMI